MFKAITTSMFILLINTFAIGQLSSVPHQVLWNNEQFKNYNPSDEIVSLRTVNSKSFKSGDQVVAITAAGPLHYFENNQWKTIFHTIVPNSAGFHNTSNSFKTFYPANSQGKIETQLVNGGVIKDLIGAKMYYLDQSGNAIHEQLIDNKVGMVDVNEITYRKVFGNHIDLRLSQLSTKRKLDYIINSPTAFSGISATAKKVVFQESIELPLNWSATLVNNVIIIKDATGKIQAEYEKPIIHETVLHDHSQDKHDHHHEHEIEGKYELIHSGGSNYTIKTIVDFAWLKDSERVFPLYIDPTINCLPQNAFEWTGHLQMNGNGLTQYNTATVGQRNNDVMRLGRLDESPDKFLNSWAKFDLTAIPDNSIICNVQLTYTVYSTYSGDTGCGTNVNIRHMANDPIPATSVALIADIRDGDIYQTRNFGGAANGTNGTKVTPNFGNIQHIQSSLIPNWVALGFEYYLAGQHDECYIYVRGYSHAQKPFLTIVYTDGTAYTNVGYTAATNGTLPPAPNCTDWSNTWCAGSGTFSQLNNLVDGVNYTVENLGTAGCGTAMTTAFMQAWAPGGALCGQTPIDGVATNNFSFFGTLNGNYYINVSSGLCGANNTCGQYTGHDFTGQSAVLRYRQNTTVTNTTPNNDLCFGETKNLTATLGGIHDNPTIVWSITQGAGLGSISGNTFTAGNTAGVVTITATVGFCSESITFNINEGPTLLNTDFTICSGEQTNIVINTSPPVASYTWTQIPSNVTGSADGSGTTIDQTLTLQGGTTGTVTYSITSTIGLCTSVEDLIVTVNSGIIPTFDPVAAICEGGTLNPLPTTSTNGITGTWSPALDNSQTTTYTFTPDAGQCASNTTLTLTVNPNITPTFTQVTAICEGGTLNPLPTSSLNGITGSWSPALNNMQTTSYTFTPDLGQCADNQSMTIQVNSGLIPTFGPIQAVCFGATGNPLPSTSLENVTGTWSPAFDNTATTIYTFTPDAGQCADPTTVSVAVNALPVINAGLDQAICTGNPVTLVGSGGVSYVWDNGVVNGTPFTPASTTTYTVTGTSATGCTNTDQVLVTVNPLPIINAGIDQAVCVGNSVILTGNGGVSYVWNNGISNGVAFTPVATTTYTVTGTDANGCQNTDQVTVTVNSLPTINAGADQVICEAQATTLTGSGGISYTWNNSVTNSVPFTPAASGTYTVTGTDANGCTNTDQVLVTISPNPPVNLTANNLVGCAPLDVQFTFNAPPGSTYNWTFGDGGSSTAGPVANHQYNGIGCFDVS